MTREHIFGTCRGDRNGEAVCTPANESGPERDRTADLLNANQALSQLSYRPKKVDVVRSSGSASKSKKVAVAKTGGPKWNCTTDPRVISTVLCSLSYRPVAT